ncbi:MAG TPA: ferritin-like domain-containing protein [Candidatus Dormibacteraeota bacterium]|nr:ferritin-like domain-containing protein [Candidatus Dormibacteraeota bacterium]
MAQLPPGTVVEVRGGHPDLEAHVRGFARTEGHTVVDARAEAGTSVLRLRRGNVDEWRWGSAIRAGAARGAPDEALAEHPPPAWGPAARGALVERGGPAFDFSLADRDEVWADEAAVLYAQACAAQWDPRTAIAWDEPFEISEEAEAAVVQVMTYLVENENAALVIPARFLGRLHPHFREVAQVLAVQVADEARHVEVFTRRALLRGDRMGTSSAGGRASLHTLVAEPEFSLASFMLSVLGEGTFLHLLSFLQRHGPDPVTRRICQLAYADEARHVAFGIAHLRRRLGVRPELRGALAAAVEHRHDALAATAGLGDDVFDALVVLAGGGLEPAQVAVGWDRVQELSREMDAGRRRRLVALGFGAEDAARLSALHTRNFM